ncbi:DNA polymerase IV [Alicyclobacillus fodiniaquatilis]|uniref:DNA polymerase IV n=1 Tax=Alicyclobacillus fodiniaquatilis TaxID=1661150 RepID=A0ABW4JSH1_9BACL
MEVFALTRIIYGLVDMQSFFASCEVASRPEYAKREELDSETDPLLAVAGDPERRSGIVLAATATAKQRGVTTAMTLGEALRLVPDLVVVRPQMGFYLHVSTCIQAIVQQYFPLQEQFSIDESFFAFPYPSVLFPDPVGAAQNLRQKIWDMFKIRCRIGLADNKWLAKMANKLAKSNPDGIVWLQKEDISRRIHPLPVEEMWGVRKRAKVLRETFHCDTIGDVASVPVGSLKQQFGVWGDVIWRWANGQDHSPINPNSTEAPHKGYSHRTTLPRDFDTKADIAVVMLELLDEVCYRVRRAGQKGRRVGLALTYGGFSGGFYRAKTLDFCSNQPVDLYPVLLSLLDKWWHGEPVRAVSISLDMLQKSESIQLSLIEDRGKRDVLARTIDDIHDTYGETSLFRAVSLTNAGQLLDRSQKIGGHSKGDM